MLLLSAEDGCRTMATDGIPWEIIATAVITLLGAITAYLKAKKDGLDRQIILTAKDSELQKEAVKDLALFGAKAFAANADHTVTQEEYDDLMTEGKVLAQKYGDKFGVGNEIRTILESFTPSPKPAAVAPAAIVTEVPAAPI